MSAPETTPTAPEAPPPPPVFVTLTAAELLWFTFSIWIGGVFILTLLPFLLIPRLGMALGVGASYLLFFVAWQPVQSITQRTFGVRTAALRMLFFVGAAATLAFYLREVLVSMQP